MSDLSLAIDIGGTKLAAGIVDGAGAVLVRDRVPTPARDVWPAVTRLVRRVLAASPEPPVNCGIGCGGPMTPVDGTVSPLHIPSWRRFALREYAEQLTGLPVVVDNDAKALALAEAWRGAAMGVNDFIGVVVGTGVTVALGRSRNPPPPSTKTRITRSRPRRRVFMGVSKVS